MEQTVCDIIESMSNRSAEDFLEQISLQIAKAVDADYLFAAKINKSKNTAQTLAFAADGQLTDNVEYSLADTPCAKVIENSVCCYPEQVAKTFPDDKLLTDRNINAYLAVPLLNSQKESIGLLVALYSKSITNRQQSTSILQLFSGRIAAEMHHIECRDKLQSANTQLEQEAVKRRASLKNTLSILEYAKTKLVESEKLAALGDLVAGIAHEVNTPLGIAVTTHSIMESEYKQLNKKIQGNTLKMSDMQSYLSTVASSLELQVHNLERAKEILGNFKLTAAEQHILELENINIRDYYQRIIDTLRSSLKKKSASITLNASAQLHSMTYPGVHAQILINLINNSLLHGFNNNDNNQISIDIKDKGGNIFVVDYHDNGIGIDPKASDKIFEPFYTTAKEQGGSGLGMSIIHSLVTERLQGSVELINSDLGIHLRFHFNSQQGDN
ncbi:sensor histidine kinase [Psychromonas ossibalaenae]|uniref:sensor histidine kinase n=1 Tax=Psychromonas ossibalaenae TaxID=444922 RepID=UPI00037B722F|nr:HAMP domain-containing sensor histidine kinase [Psychromonas ossibalaenae]